MELIGEEKRIQALFSEARKADKQAAPSFAAVWQRAQSQTRRQSRAFNLAFVAAMAVLVCVLVSLAWWSTHRQVNPEVIATVPPAPVASPVNAGVGKQKVILPKGTTFHPRSPVIKLRPRSEGPMVAANRKAMRDAKAIAGWKSPTSTLLDSPSEGLLKSLPQMNQTVDEMKSFLPSQPK
jgi:hypothetical protein